MTGARDCLDQLVMGWRPPGAGRHAGLALCRVPAKTLDHSGVGAGSLVWIFHGNGVGAGGFAAVGHRGLRAGRTRAD